MSVDLSPSEFQRSIAATIDGFSADRCTPETIAAAAREFPRDLWRDLAGLGVFAAAGIGREEHDGMTAVCAACESLGRAVFPGPVAATYMAAEILEDDERERVVDGSSLVAFGDGGLVPWAPVADVFLMYVEGAVWDCSTEGGVEAVATLGGEPWGRVALVRRRMLAPIGRPLAVFNMAHAAYVAGAGRRLVERTAQHANTRRQFGKTLGDFQAVAHPLADCVMQLDAAAALARAAACAIDETGPAATLAAAAARRSADNAAKRTAVVCHQVFGAIGITVEGPVFEISRRLQQASAVPPNPRMFDPRLVESIAQSGISHE